MKTFLQNSLMLSLFAVYLRKILKKENNNFLRDSKLVKLIWKVSERRHLPFLFKKLQPSLLVHPELQ